jgi:hypothetical protein
MQPGWQAWHRTSKGRAEVWGRQGFGLHGLPRETARTGTTGKTIFRGGWREPVAWRWVAGWMVRLRYRHRTGVSTGTGLLALEIAGPCDGRELMADTVTLVH